jgi:serine/threonine protein kinase
MSESKLSLQEILTIGIQIVEALDAAHQAGVIHRDIKPENIMLRKDGYVKVLDFGLAKLAEKQTRSRLSDIVTRTADTQTGIVIGTSRYMSPEQARGLKVDARSDIFSLGIVLYELMTGKRPFDGRTSTDILAEIVGRNPPPLTTFGDFPEELNWAINKTLEKEPEELYQTA